MNHQNNINQMCNRIRSLRDDITNASYKGKPLNQVYTEDLEIERNLRLTAKESPFKNKADIANEQLMDQVSFVEQIAAVKPGEDDKSIDKVFYLLAFAWIIETEQRLQREWHSQINQELKDRKQPPRSAG